MSRLAYVVDFRGFPACPCLAAWFPVFERLAIVRGIVRESFDIAQLIGGAVESAGTHSEGGAFDVWQHDPETQRLGREMGAATFNRTTGSFADNRHSHGVLVGCPHNGPARYQIGALELGFNGLGKAGRGGLDTGPGPRKLRTWREGIAWGLEQIERHDMANVWDERLPEYDENSKTDSRRASVLLAGAHDRAGDAKRHAKEAHQLARANASAIAELSALVRELIEKEK